MRTLTQLVGTTATTSNELYPISFTTLAGNNSSSAVAIGKGLINDQHRYLLQRYFDNERTVTISTIAGGTKTLTGSLAIAATSATLTVAWAYPTSTQLVTFSNGEQRSVLFTLNSTGISWSVGLVSTATISITTAGVQFYDIPADVSKIKNDTITIGQLKYQPKFIQSIQDWDAINLMPYQSDIPNYCFIYNGKIGFFPIPSSTGNIITFNYKARVADMSYTDYSIGNLSVMTVGSTIVSGSSSLWTAFPQNVDIRYQNLYLRADMSTGGDGLWYPILKFTSATTLTLALPVLSAPNITGASTYTIGQMPLLSEDFHDMMVYGALKVYFSSIVPDSNRFKEFDALYTERKLLLEDYAGTKQVNVDLGSTPDPVNPNLFLYPQTAQS